MRDKIMKRLREKRVFIPLISLFVILAISGIWWFVSSQSANNPQSLVEKADQLIAVEIAKNFKGEITIDEFKTLLDEHRVEKVYHQYREKGYGSVIEYYIKLKGEKGYYYSQATIGTGYMVPTTLGVAIYPLNDYLAQGAWILFGDEIEFKLLTTTPSVPTDKTMLLIMGVSLLVFILLIWLLGGRLMRGNGGFTKAQQQEVKKAVYFADVGGVDEALEESKEVVEMIKAQGDGKNDKR